MYTRLEYLQVFACTRSTSVQHRDQNEGAGTRPEAGDQLSYVIRLSTEFRGICDF